MALAPPSLPVLRLWQPVAGSPCRVFTETPEIRAPLAGACPWFSGLLGLSACQRFRPRAARCQTRTRAGHDDIPKTCHARGRRHTTASIAFGAAAPPHPATAESQRRQGDLVTVRDPETYSALVYSPRDVKGPLPLLVVLPGAGRNDKDATDLANIRGEHGGLAPSLIAEGIAPADLTENFAVLAPYAAGKNSFYEEPRKKMLQFIAWACSDAGRAAGVPAVDPKRLFLFGFSDGATEVMELASTRRFAGCVVAAYGFTGELPRLALERLKDIPVWVFHSADDVIFPVSCSDKLVKRLKETNSRDVVRYTRYDKDQEGFTGSVRGHSTGITDEAAKLPGESGLFGDLDRNETKDLRWVLDYWRSKEPGRFEEFASLYYGYFLAVIADQLKVISEEPWPQDRSAVPHASRFSSRSLTSQSDAYRKIGARRLYKKSLQDLLSSMRVEILRKDEAGIEYCQIRSNLVLVGIGQGMEKLRAFLRCLGGLHNRAEHAERAARHWQSLWEESFRKILDVRRTADSSTLGYEVQVSDLLTALSSTNRERERLAKELESMQRTFQSATDTQLWHRYGQELQLRQLWGATSEQFSHCALLQRQLAAEAAVSKQLRKELLEAQQNHSVAEAKHGDADARAKEAERYAEGAKDFVHKQVDDALKSQWNQFQEELELERKGWRKDAAAAIPLPLAREVLAAYSDLWRCTSGQVPGRHRAQAERALRRLRDLDAYAVLLPPQDEMLQEPLRRAVGEADARSMAKALVEELQQCHTPAEKSKNDLSGWGATTQSSHPRSHVSLRARTMIMASENRRPPYLSALIHELYRHKKTRQLFIRVLYNGEVQKVCHGHGMGLLCPLEKWEELVARFTPSPEECPVLYAAYDFQAPRKETMPPWHSWPQEVWNWLRQRAHQARSVLQQHRIDGQDLALGSLLLMASCLSAWCLCRRRRSTEQSTRLAADSSDSDNTPMPVRQVQERLDNLVERMARELNAPRFDFHVTLFSSIKSANLPELKSSLEMLAGGLQPFDVSFGEDSLAVYDTWNQNVLLLAEETAELKAANLAAQRIFADPAAEEAAFAAPSKTPHGSLLYGPHGMEERQAAEKWVRQEAGWILTPWSFKANRIVLYETETPKERRWEGVPTWKKVAEFPFKSK
ncbi:unnamed protein product [Symbiodinium sp. CCMP2456]|nr:unnamed protein product [Symbiodinium sp. CCMP2456]